MCHLKQGTGNADPFFFYGSIARPCPKSRYWSGSGLCLKLIAVTELAEECLKLFLGIFALIEEYHIIIEGQLIFC